MPYSAVIQPLPVLRRNGGTFSSTEAVQSTWVSPKRARHEPSAYLAAPGSSTMRRISSGARPEGRGMGGTFFCLGGETLVCPPGAVKGRAGKSGPPVDAPEPPPYIPGAMTLHSRALTGATAP